MQVFDEIDSLVTRANSVIRQKTRKEKLKLYAEGLKAKIKQADFALSTLSTFADRTDETVTSTAAEETSISDRVHFYCDASWTFLYSSLDVLAQLINQALKLQLKERHANFGEVKKVLDSRYGGKDIQKRFSACLNSNAFKNLEAYRNCSTHRRQIYIETKVSRVGVTAGYRASTAGPLETVERMLCDNPLQLNPKTKQKRRIPTYMEEISAKMLDRIQKIVKAVNPVA